jgi:hypothetical protein
MKKRKPPILLLSILFVLGGAMAVYAIRPWEQTDTEGPTPTDVIGQKHPSPSAGQLKAQVSQAAKGAKSKGGLPEPAPAPQVTISTKETGQYSKPKPPANGTTNSQWYETGH